ADRRKEPPPTDDADRRHDSLAKAGLSRRQPYSHLFLYNNTPPTEIYTLSLHDALPISSIGLEAWRVRRWNWPKKPRRLHWTIPRSEEHTSELQSRSDLVCRLLLEKKKTPITPAAPETSTSCGRTLAPTAPPASPTHALA